MGLSVDGRNGARMFLNQTDGSLRALELVILSIRKPEPACKAIQSHGSNATSAVQGQGDVPGYPARDGARPNKRKRFRRQRQGAQGGKGAGSQGGVGSQQAGGQQGKGGQGQGKGQAQGNQGKQ
eukprot:7449045-Karenia_brevis.AAC.1